LFLLQWLLGGGRLIAAPADVNPSELLARADAIKTVDNKAFVQLLSQLDKKSATFSAEQQWQLRYLEAWEEVYLGDFTKARLHLETIIREAPPESIRLNAEAALVNILGYSHRYEDAYAELERVIDALPRVQDKNLRFHLLGESSQLLADAAQYDLAAHYADQIIADNKGGRNHCIGVYLKAHANFLGGRMAGWNTLAQQAIAACTTVRENLFADAMRQDMANLAIRQYQTSDALALLEMSYPHVVEYRYPEMIAEQDALLAKAYWQEGDAPRAEKFAMKAVDAAKKGEYTEPLATAYELLYQIERNRGNLREALAYHENYMAADKGRLDELREKAQAYQLVIQQVEAKKIELNELSKKNQILQLQQALDHKAVVTSRLYIALLLTVLASIALLLYRLKRSQLRFMRLARRDGLTGIFNRQHFVEEAEQALRYAAKSLRGACLILIDLDHFKNINDTYGHVAGDHALRRAVSICQQHLHSSDVFGRIGGEEFGILLPECGLLQALERAESIRQAIQSMPEDGTGHVPLTASFGVATTAHHGYDLRRLLVAADSALYRAKRDGRNRVVVSMNDHVPSPSSASHGARDDTFASGPAE
jgi:diguanylate cyclase (GGDEF)-like protein